MARRQQEYGSAEELTRKIDMNKSKLTKIRLRLATQRLTQEQVDSLNKQVRTIEDSTLPNLKNALAAFNTMLLPGITDDPAVVIVR